MTMLCDIKPSYKHFGSNRSEDPNYITDGKLFFVAMYMKRWRGVLGKRRLKIDEGIGPASPKSIAAVLPSPSELAKAQPIEYLETLPPQGTSSYKQHTFPPRAVYGSVKGTLTAHFNANYIAILHHVFGLGIELRAFADNQKVLVYTEDGNFAGLIMPLRKAN